MSRIYKEREVIALDTHSSRDKATENPTHLRSGVRQTTALHTFFLSFFGSCNSHSRFMPPAIPLSHLRAEDIELPPQELWRIDAIGRHVLEQSLDIIFFLADQKNSKTLPLSTSHMTTERKTG